MSVAETLSTAGRTARRIQTARPATLRDAQRRPIDIFIENLSAAGFGMSTMTGLAPGARVSLQLPGLEAREAQVVRRLGLSYGCEFAVPLDPPELALALGTGSVGSGILPFDDYRSDSSGTDKSVSRLGRIAILVAVNIVLWAAIIASLYAIL